MGGTGSPGATHRHPGTLGLQTTGSYPAFNKSAGSWPSTLVR
jgi:hypothetical protein